MDEVNPTGQRLKLIFSRLKRDAGPTEKQPTVSQVAREAGVSHTLIYNKHSKLAEEIRKNNGKDSESKLTKSQETLDKAKKRLRDRLKEVAGLKLLNRGLASQNGTLLLMVKQLEARVAALEAGAVPLRAKRQK